MTENKEHPFFWLAVAMTLDGKRCAMCGHTYDSRESIIAHKPIKGFNDDVVGRECWDSYLLERDKPDPRTRKQLDDLNAMKSASGLTSTSHISYNEILKMREKQNDNTARSGR